MRRLILFLLSSLASCALYLGVSLAQIHAPTFPLDDAWIHLTFARNLALHHELAFRAGQPSAGSTSPLWSLALAPAFVLPIAPEWWDYLLGGLLLFAMTLLVYLIARRLFADAVLATACALGVAYEWHLNWAAFSGMETLLFVALLLLMYLLYVEERPAWLVGVVSGLCVVTRPEGVILFGLLAAHQFLVARDWRRTAAMLLAFAVPLMPYVWFNWTTSGLLFPNTFYAKQVEYAQLFVDTPAALHYVRLLADTLVGAQLLLVPGLIFALWLALREMRWSALVLIAWWLLLPMAYALRLPVDYQHARYEMPAIPAMLLVGMWGTWRLRERLPDASLTRVFSNAWTLSFPLLLVIFWFTGATARADDAAAIDCLEVQTAQWLAANVPADDVIAAHDIGAIGYYLADRPLIDLAGLITPDVIYFLRDEPRLLEYIMSQHTRFVVTSAAWHPNLIRDPRLQRVFQQDCARARQTGGYQIGIYQVTQP